MKSLVVTLLFASSLTVMAGAVIMPALPLISDYFQEIPDIDFYVRLMVTLPALFTAIGSLIVGSLLNQFGRKPFLIGGLMLYGASGGSVLGIDSLLGIMIGRALLGLSVGAVATSTTTLIADNFSGEDRYRLLGFQGTFMQLGGVVFIGAAGFLAEYYWRAPFAIYLISWLIAIAAWFFVSEPPSAVASGKLERARLSNVVPRAFRADFIILCLCGCFLMMVLYMLPTYMPFYLERKLEVGGLAVGLSLAATNLCAAVAASLYSRLRKLLGCHRILGVSSLLMGVGYLLIANSEDYFDVVVAMLCFGVGWGFVIPNVMTWVNDLAYDHTRGMAVGILSMAFFLGQFISPFFFGSVFEYFSPRRGTIVVGMLLFALAIGALFWSRAYQRILNATNADVS